MGLDEAAGETELATTAVHEARGPEEIAACYPVVAQLRPHLDETTFVQQVIGQRDADRYRLIYLEEDGEVVAVAGFRVTQMLSRGRFLYVDDLVTDEDHRSQGHGSRLLAWLVDEARRQGCQRLDLDSGLQREAAHRFYEREGLRATARHLAMDL